MRPVDPDDGQRQWHSSRFLPYLALIRCCVMCQNAGETLSGAGKNTANGGAAVAEEEEEEEEDEI